MITPSLTTRSIPSPLTTHVPNLSPEEIAALPYPPDYYPGARDVKTPYGSMRVYEWEEGHDGSWRCDVCAGVEEGCGGVGEEGL